MTYQLAIKFTIAVFVAQIILTLTNAYFYWPGADIPMHFAGGAAVGMWALAIWNDVVASIQYRGKLFQKFVWLMPLLFIVGFTAIVGVGWELHEFIIDQIMTLKYYGTAQLTQGSIQDTMGDFVCDLLGGASVIIFLLKKV
ncbi:MAG: hypothetical protein WC730_00425 [Patescibacteria group bacterium]|jgi:hypothetical protein